MRTNKSLAEILSASIVTVVVVLAVVVVAVAVVLHWCHSRLTFNYVFEFAIKDDVRSLVKALRVFEV